MSRLSYAMFKSMEFRAGRSKRDWINGRRCNIVSERQCNRIRVTVRRWSVECGEKTRTLSEALFGEFDTTRKEAHSQDKDW